jgi:hypothetical protein
VQAGGRKRAGPARSFGRGRHGQARPCGPSLSPRADSFRVRGERSRDLSFQQYRFRDESLGRTQGTRPPTPPSPWRLSRAFRGPGGYCWTLKSGPWPPPRARAASPERLVAAVEAMSVSVSGQIRQRRLRGDEGWQSVTSVIRVSVPPRSGTTARRNRPEKAFLFGASPRRPQRGRARRGRPPPPRGARLPRRRVAGERSWGVRLPGGAALSMEKLPRPARAPSPLPKPLACNVKRLHLSSRTPPRGGQRIQVCLCMSGGGRPQANGSKGLR